jgi:hypothetical protein
LLASLRDGCAFLVRHTVGNSKNAVFDERCAEIDQRAEALVSQLEIGLELFFVDSGDFLYLLKFDNHLVFDHQVSAISHVDFDPFIVKWNRLFGCVGH